jgi:hypothetical protein
MIMTQKALPGDLAPDWFLQAVRIMQSTERGVYDIDSELRRVAAIEDIDPRLTSELQNVRDALGVVKVSLSVMDKVMEEVIEELEGSEAPDRKQAVAK